MTSLLDLNSDCSDSEDDVDYVPPDNVCSEDSGDGKSDADSADENEGDQPAKKSTKKRKKSAKTNIKIPVEVEEKPEITAEEEKKRVDDLYKSFLEDVQPITKKPETLPTSTNGSSSSSTSKVENIEKKVTITEEYEFAGETVTVTKEVDNNTLQSTEIEAKQVTANEPDKTVSFADKTLKKTDSPSSSAAPLKRPAGGLSSVLGTLNKKKQKISTLQKSLLDWSNFKKAEGITEELEHHNKGKEGYLERQAFLQRSDLRQFELERELRMSRRKPL